MTAQRRDLEGKVFGRLTVLEVVGSGRHGLVWRCRCSCGEITDVLSGKLVSGGKQSCGGKGCWRPGPKRKGGTDAQRTA